VQTHPCGEFVSPARGFRRIRQAHLREAPLYLRGIAAWHLAALLLAGCSGSEPVGPLPDPDPVASVEILGPSRVKVGEAYQMVAVVRHANGEVSDQPVAWSVNDSTVGWVSSNGMVIADTALPFSLIARAGDLADTVDIEGYDWIYDESLASRLLLLESDAKITVGGGSGYPRLMVGCIAGTSWVALIATPAVVDCCTPEPPMRVTNCWRSRSAPARASESASLAQAASSTNSPSDRRASTREWRR
jgi:hypothetical protein